LRRNSVDFLDVEFAGAEAESLDVPTSPTSRLAPPSLPKVSRHWSHSFMSEDGMPQPIEFFIASDASAIVQHTKRVLYLEDDDIAHIAEGQLAIHHLRRDESGKAETPAIRNIEMPEIEIAEIMKAVELPLDIKNGFDVDFPRHLAKSVTTE
ncbi:hypothetical protein C8R48DRAFT_680428, partial [Suillus tomentosus]